MGDFGILGLLIVDGPQIWQHPFRSVVWRHQPPTGPDIRPNHGFLLLIPPGPALFPIAKARKCLALPLRAGSVVHVA